MSSYSFVRMLLMPVSIEVCMNVWLKVMWKVKKDADGEDVEDDKSWLSLNGNTRSHGDEHNFFFFFPSLLQLFFFSPSLHS